MQRKYVIAIAIGCTVGLYALACVAQLSPSNVPEWTSTLISLEPGHFPDPRLASDLQEKAHLLNACKIFLADGFWYLSIPSFALCGFSRFTEIAVRKRWAFCVAAGTASTIIGSIAIGVLWAFGAANIDTGIEHANVMKKTEYFLGVLAFLECACWFSGLGEVACVFAILVFGFAADRVPPFDDRYGRLWTRCWTEPSEIDAIAAGYEAKPYKAVFSRKILTTAR